MSRYGPTIPEAASARIMEVAKASDRLAELTGLVEAALLADLPGAVEKVVERIGEIAAIATDVPALMAALPSLARVVRYGNVRSTDAGAVATVVNGFVERIAIGLPGACASLDDDAADAMLPLIVSTDAAIALLDDAEQVATWRATLAVLQDQAGLHGLVAGRVCRLLLDDRAIDIEEATRRMRFALSRGASPAAAASWVEGFLRDSGTILIHDEALFGVFDAWVMSLAADAFEPVLPLLRRTVATFPAPERRTLGERVRSAPMAGEARDDGGLDTARADAVLPVLALLLGVELPVEERS